MLCAENEDETGGLGIEGAGDVGEGLLHKLFNPGVGDRGGRGEGVVCSSRGDDLHERCGISHSEMRVYDLIESDTAGSVN